MRLVEAMPTIVIGALMKDTDSTLSLTQEEASWFGSMIFITHTVGSVGSGVLQDMYGRKRCLAVVGIPLVVSWFLLYNASSIVHLFVANFIMGLSTSLIEAPIHSYIGEISQPRLRGVFCSLSSVWFNIGTVIVSILGATLSWRYMAFFSMIGPITSITLMSLVPESPAWLVSKGRIPEAEKSLQWLRGWVGPEDIKDELDDLVTYVKETQDVKEENVDVPYGVNQNNTFLGFKIPRSLSSWKHLLEPDVLVAIRIVSIFFIVSICVTLTAMRPFFIEIFTNLQIAFSPEMFVAVCGVLQTLGSVSLAVGLKLTGKRPLSFLSIGVNVVVCLGLATYLWTGLHLPWLMVVLFGLSSYFGRLCTPVPWILLIELFPLRARGLASGLLGTFNYLVRFLVIKVYYTMAALLGVAGVCCAYGVVGLLGIIYLYWDLPETEGVSLEDIEWMLSERRLARSGR